jgi:hypothetical protein
MTVLTPFAAIEDVLRTLFRADFPALAGSNPNRVGSFVPPNLKDVLPFVRVGRIGGPQGKLEDRPVVDIEVFHDTLTGARDLDSALTAYLHSGRLQADLGSNVLVVIDAVRTETTGQEIPWDDPEIRRVASTHTFTVRRR